MKLICLVCVFLAISTSLSLASQIETIGNSFTNKSLGNFSGELKVLEFYPDSLDNLNLEDGPKKVKFRRGKAILFTILTGPLGGHRVYLGTRPRTPIIYTIMLGGLGILPLVDLIHLIISRDMSQFIDNPKIIMWF